MSVNGVCTDIQIVKQINDIMNRQSLGGLRAFLKREVIRKIIREVDFASDGSILILDQDDALVEGNAALLGQELASRFTGRSGHLEHKIDGKDYVVVYQKSSYTGWNTVGLVPKAPTTCG